jgi:hypothetical protein
MASVTSELTIRVTGYRVFAVRWAIASLFFRLGGLISGVRVEIADAD